MSLRCLEPRETFHPDIGPSEEARILHVEQQRLVERCLATPEFHLWDVGLGAAANVLTAIKTFQAQVPADHPIVIQSFEKTFAPLRFAIANSQELGYLVGFESTLEELMDKKSVKIGKNITWNLHGDFTKAVSDKTLRAPDAVFYDPYSAKGNFEMWNLEHFKKLHAALDPNRPCILTNYTASTYVRVTLLLAGFQVGLGWPIGKKLHTTIFTNCLNLLEKPLDKWWLNNRLRNSHSAAPITVDPHPIAPISEEDFEYLSKLPQFQSLDKEKLLDHVFDLIVGH